MASSLSSLSLTSSDDENTAPSRVYRQRMDPLDYYNDEEFKARYRLTKQTVVQLVELIGIKLKPFSVKTNAISATEQILLTISFYASGAFQITVADIIRVHKSTACRIIKNVSHELAQLRRQFVKMPTSLDDRNKAKRDFYAIKSFPNIIGAVDCTHIKIQSPGGDQAELYRNRKGYFSLNIQAISDAQLKIMDVIARWPGSVHDTTIFNDSHIRADFERGVHGNGCLLGDSGYPCRPYLLTPILRPASPSDQAYNEAHIATRNTVERCFGVLKRRFPCLSMGLRTKIQTTMDIIVTCCVLHNIAIDNNDLVEEEQNEEAVGQEDSSYESPSTNENTAVRSSLLLTHFRR